MAQSDGWVAECVSADHTVVPDLSGWTEPVAVAPVGNALDSDTFGSDLLSNGSYSLAPVSNEPEFEETSGRSSGKRVLAGAVAVAVLAIGGYLAAPTILSMFDDSVEPPPVLALGDEPTQRLVVSGGSIYLEGSVPDESTSRLFEVAARNALGADRVINNFEISNTAVFDPSQPVLLSVAETVLFPTGQATVNEEYKGLIDLAVELMDSQPKTILQIVGHTDDRGAEDVNLQLSVERAEAVAAEIERRGVAGSRLSVDGRGETQPIMTNDSEEGRSANRRVEFLISGLLD
ncbi:MAG: OmpA family protein [Acidimicrobiales bacterium]